MPQVQVLHAQATATSATPSDQATTTSIASAPPRNLATSTAFATPVASAVAAAASDAPLLLQV